MIFSFSFGIVKKEAPLIYIWDEVLNKEQCPLRSAWVLINKRLTVLTSGEGNGTPLQYSCLENPKDGGARLAAVYGVAQSRIRLKRLSSSSSILFFIVVSDSINLHSHQQCKRIPLYSYPLECIKYLQTK